LRPGPTEDPLHQLPNLLSAARIGCFPLLLWLAATGREEPFQWLLLAALVSDILDGLLARSFGFVSELGARLDSIADALTMGAAAYGVLKLQPEFVHAHGAWMVLVLGLWVLEMLASLWRYGRLSSFHTYLVRVGAYALGIFVVALFLWGFDERLFVAAVAINVVAYLEEFVLLWLLPQWTANVRGAWWVIRARRRA
jgi:CDP-diacylglycerol--glycerol-3-phosphate 3-phosphatidyltransferase